MLYQISYTNHKGITMMSKRIILSLLFIMVAVYYLLGSNETPIRSNLPDEIVIRFHHSASEEEIDAFIEKFSEFGFSKESKIDDVYSRSMTRKFSYNSKHIYGRDLLKLIREESIVERANFKYPFVPGRFTVIFEKYQSLEEIQEFATKFSRFDMRFSRRFAFGNGVIYTFNDDLIEHHTLWRLLMDEENVEFVLYDDIFYTH